MPTVVTVVVVPTVVTIAQSVASVPTVVTIAQSVASVPTVATVMTVSTMFQYIYYKTFPNGKLLTKKYLP